MYSRFDNIYALITQMNQPVDFDHFSSLIWSAVITVKLEQKL